MSASRGRGNQSLTLALERVAGRPAVGRQLLLGACGNRAGHVWRSTYDQMQR